MTNHVEYILIATFSSNVLHFNAPPLLDDPVRLVLEMYHWRQVGGDGIRRPNLRMDNAVKRPAKLLDCAQAGQ